jgi:DNA-directed RNA polymerase specialized sigma24 family protein
MSSDDTVNRAIEQLKAGDERAAQAIWEAYFQRLIVLARRKLAALPRRAADEEDVVLSAFNSFYKGVAEDRFPQLEDRFDLWKLLVTITARKVVAERRRQMSQKRGGGRVRGESVFAHNPNDASHDVGINGIIAREPTADFASALADECGDLLQGLDKRLGDIALLKMEGYTNQEISVHLDVALRTVERRLEQIRQLWSK